MQKIPRAFCVKNDRTENRTMFLKRKIEGKVVPKEWRVGLFFGPTENRIRRGWKTFCKENNLKIRDKCIFQLVSKDTFLVETQDCFDSVSEENRPSPRQHNVHTEKMVRSSRKGPAYIEIKDLSESDNGTISRVSDGEIHSNVLNLLEI